MTISTLERLLDNLLQTDRRKAAEVAYVLARLHDDKGDTESARKFAQQSISLFESTPTNSLEDCAASYVTLEGIALPSIVHADVVRNRFRHLDL